MPTDTDAYVSAITNHLTRPLPDEGFHLPRLHESRDFSSSAPDADPDDSTEDGSGDGAGGDLPPLLRALIRQGWFGDLLLWRTGGRVVIAGVGHEDKEEVTRTRRSRWSCSRR